ncbi:MAG: hypothetical protein LUF30_02600 [Lachnospiraceae bacterium]|nr:hypothetical protein [Lachnospiraceae bacterium]
MTEDEISRVKTELKNKKGKEAYAIANAVLEADEEDSQAWYYLMQTFELVLPIDRYQSSNELTCGENAIDCASSDEKAGMAAQVYAFYLRKAQNVLEYEEKKLADAREIASYFQRKVYFDEVGAVKMTFEKDKPLIQAVQRSFSYVFDLFDGVAREAVRSNPDLNALCGLLARQWRRTYSYLEIRYEFYRKQLTEDEIRYGLERYAHLLRDVTDADSIIEKTVPFNLHQWDQKEYLERARGMA